MSAAPHPARVLPVVLTVALALALALAVVLVPLLSGPPAPVVAVSSSPVAAPVVDADRTAGPLAATTEQPAGESAAPEGGEYDLESPSPGEVAAPHRQGCVTPTCSSGARPAPGRTSVPTPD